MNNISSTPSPAHPFIEDTPTGIRITWQGRKDWGRFSSSSLTILVNLLAVGVIAYYTGPGAIGDTNTRIVTLILLTIVGMYLLYRVYNRVKDLTTALLDHEVIQVDAQGVTIEHSGFLNVERQVVHPADRIQSIGITTLGLNRCLFLSFKTGGKILTSYKPGIDPIFCRGISEADATAALAKIQERFPQYRDIK
jgi:hypothetical protein